MAALMKEFLGTSYLFGGNAPFIEELYEKYLEDPEAVDPQWRRWFDLIQQPGQRDVAHQPVREAFARLAYQRPGAEARRWRSAGTNAWASTWDSRWWSSEAAIGWPFRCGAFGTRSAARQA